MARKKKVVDEAPVDVEETSISAPEETPEEKGGSVSVYKDGKFVRTYSVKDHGKSYKAFAGEFAEKNKAEVRSK